MLSLVIQVILFWRECLVPPVNRPSRPALSFSFSLFNKAVKPFRPFVIALLCLQLALPMPRGFAAPGDETATVTPQLNPGEQAVADVIGEIQRAGNEGTRLALTWVDRNIALLLSQRLVDLRVRRGQSETSWDLSVENLTRPEPNIAPGVVERSLIVEKIENGVRLRIDGHRYAHDVTFARGVELVDFDWNEEQVRLLTSDGTRHAIEVSSLRQFLYKAAFPVFNLGQVKTANGKKPNGVRFILRRVDPIDQTRDAQEARLDRNPKTKKTVEIIADRRLVARLEENLEMVRPIPPCRELEVLLRGASPDQQLYYDSGDVAYTHKEGDVEEIVSIESRHFAVGAIGLQRGVIDGLQSLADPETAESVKRIQGAQGSAQEAMAEVIRDPERMQRFYASGVSRVLARMPRNGLDSINQYTLRYAARVAQTEQQGTPLALRDRFTGEEWLEDYKYFQEMVGNARVTAERNEPRGWWDVTRTRGYRRFWELGMGDRLKKWNPLKRVRQLTTALKWPAIVAAGLAVGAGADYMANHGNGVQLAVDSGARVYNYVVKHQVPVLQDWNYVADMVRYSMTARIAIMLSIFALAWMARPFLQHGVNKIVVIFGIKYLFAISIVPPQRFLLHGLRRPHLLRAMKRGHMPWQFLIPFYGANEEVIDAATNRMEDDDTLRSIAKALAIHALAVRYGCDPLVILQANKAYPGTAKEFENLATNLANVLLSEDGRRAAEALRKHPETFAETLKQLHTTAEKVGRMAGTGKVGRLPFVRCVLVHQMIAAVGNFGEEKFQNLLNPQPSEDFAKYIRDGFFVDGIFTIFLTSFTGSFADPAKADMLVYQPGVPFFRTHPFQVLGDGEQAALHIGMSAAVDYLSSALDGVPIFASSRPAGEMDRDREQGQRGFFRDTGGLLYNLLNLRGSNYVTGFGQRSWNQMVTLLQGFFLIGMFLRLFEGVVKGEPLMDIFSWNTFVHATVGQLYFIYLAPFTYRWVWAVILNVRRKLAANIATMSAGFKDRFTQLDAAVEKGDLADAVTQAREMVRLYQRQYLSVPRNVLAAIEEQPGDAEEAWALRVVGVARAYPPAATDTVATGHVVKLEADVTALKLAQDALVPDSSLADVEAMKKLRKTAVLSARDVATHYRRGTVAVPDDAKAEVATQLRETYGEETLAWVTRVLNAVREAPPVPEDVNSRASSGLIFVGSVVTTILATYLMADSFADRPFMGYPVPEGETAVPDWNVLNGVSPHDSLPVLMAKCLGTVWLFWVAGHLFNTTYDAAKYGAMRLFGRGKNEESERARAAALAELRASYEAMRTVPGVRYVLPASGTTAGADDTAEKCSALMKKGAPAT